MFRPYANCMYCGALVDLFGFDEDGELDCTDEDGHDYPIGIER